jgi:hypothetical protein
MDILAKLSPLLDAGVSLAGILLLAMMARVAAWAQHKLALDTDETVRGYLNEALQRAVDYGETQLTLRLGRLPASREEMDEMEALARDYATGAVPDALRRFKVGPTELRRLIVARMPATLPAPPPPQGG